jgi:hypothetical protein
MYLVFKHMTVLDPCVKLEHLFNSPKFSPSFDCSSEEHAKAGREHLHHLEEFVFIQAMCEKRLLAKHSVSLCCPVVEKDLVVSEVVSLIEHEKLVLISVLKTNDGFATANHENFVEHLAFPHNYLVANVDSAPEVRNDVAEEIFSCLLLLVEKEVTELSLEPTK